MKTNKNTFSALQFVLKFSHFFNNYAKELKKENTVVIILMLIPCPLPPLLYFPPGVEGNVFTIEMRQA